ncbi:MAG: DUF6567 family protein [Bacteroidia bacterium]
MKHYSHLILLFSLFLYGCGTHSSLITNQNQNATQVVLSESNYKIIGKVEGSSAATYVFGIGGLKHQSLINDARKKMYEQAALEGTAKAIVYESVSIKNSLFPIVNKTTITVSGYVVEFEKK